MGAHRAYIDWADIPQAAKAKIAGGNLTRLLKGLRPPREIVNAGEDQALQQALDRSQNAAAGAMEARPGEAPAAPADAAARQAAFNKLK